MNQETTKRPAVRARSVRNIDTRFRTVVNVKFDDGQEESFSLDTVADRALSVGLIMSYNPDQQRVTVWNPEKQYLDSFTYRWVTQPAGEEVVPIRKFLDRLERRDLDIIFALA